VIKMSRKTNIIPRAPIARIITKAGAKRVSEKAADALADIIKEKSLKIAEKAVEISHHAGRKTVQEEDVKLAAKH